MKFFSGLLLLFCVLYANAQPHETYKAEQNGTACASLLKLYADGNYVYQTGCEASPQVSFGKWIKEKDRMKFTPVNPRTYAVIKTVAATSVPGDSIWLTILDKDGLNMTAKISVGLEVSGRGSYLFGNEASGTQKFVHKRSGGIIVFRTLQKLFGQQLQLPTDTANHFIVTLNLSADWINSTHADWNNTLLPLLLTKGDALMPLAKRNGQPVFQKQKEQ